MYYSPMIVNGDPNFQYPPPAPMMQGPNNFYPNDPNLPPMGPEMHQQGMVMAPHMMPPNDQFHPNWRPMMGHHRPHRMEPPRHGGMRPHMPHRFPRGYRGNGPWRPREPWRGQAPGIPGKNSSEAECALLSFIYTNKFILLFCLKFCVFKIKHKIVQTTVKRDKLSLSKISQLPATIRIVICLSNEKEVSTISNSRPTIQS